MDCKTVSMDFSLSKDTIREALSYIPAEDRATWTKMGLAIWDELGDEGFHLWDEWSQSASNYKEKSARSVWKSLARAGGAGGRATIASVLWEAKQYGFKLAKGTAIRHTAEERQRLEAERAARREAQRLAEEAAHKAAAARAQAIWDAAEPVRADFPYLVRKGVQAHGARWAPVWVNEWMDYETGEIVRREVRDAMLLPIWAGPGRLSSLQAIFPSSSNRLKRDKDYLPDGKKAGCYCLIGRITPETHTAVVVEGWATGASVHEATGWPVMVAFDAGNLLAVAKSLRTKVPGLRIVIGGDNDAFTKNAKGEPFNPGEEAAKKAAAEVSGILALPCFTILEGQPTDWNDLHAQAGLDAVRSQLEQAVNPQQAPAQAEESAPWEDDGETTEPPAAKKKAEPPTDSELERNGHFTVLGYDHRVHYVFAHGKRQILELSTGEMTNGSMIELAPLNWWEMNFPSSGQGKIDRDAVMEFIVRTAERRGIYDPSRLRGRGAWVDDGRMVYHHGAYLTIDGVTEDVTSISSRYVYELRKSLPTDPADKPMSSEEGEELVELAKLFRWTKPGSAALLAGWVALAPVCGALRWRPHIWLTGGAGCGKSTVLNDYCHLLMGGCDVFAQGNSSEAGIRQKLGADALPVLYDESEQNDDREKARVQAILSLIRQSSTESDAQTLKGTAGGDAMAFHIRSMFCLASIQVGMRHQADVERLAVLALRPKRDDEDAAGTWATISGSLARMKHDKDLPARLLRRALDLLPVTLENIKVFARVAAKRFGSQRDGDQYGTLLAGCWSLTSTQVATEEQALELLESYDWSEHMESSDADESVKALAALMERGIRVGSSEMSVYQIVRDAAGPGSVGSERTADEVLARHGMRVKTEGGKPRLMLSNTSENLRALLSDTPYGADLRGLLLRLPGADRCGNRVERFGGARSKCISISLEEVLQAGPADDRYDPPAF